MRAKVEPREIEQYQKTLKRQFRAIDKTADAFNDHVLQWLTPRNFNPNYYTKKFIAELQRDYKTQAKQLKVTVKQEVLREFLKFSKASQAKNLPVNRYRFQQTANTSNNNSVGEEVIRQKSFCCG